MFGCSPSLLDILLKALAVVVAVSIAAFITSMRSASVRSVGTVPHDTVLMEPYGRNLSSRAAPGCPGSHISCERAVLHTRSADAVAAGAAPAILGR